MNWRMKSSMVANLLGKPLLKVKLKLPAREDFFSGERMVGRGRMSQPSIGHFIWWQFWWKACPQEAMTGRMLEDLNLEESERRLVESRSGLKQFPLQEAQTVGPKSVASQSIISSSGIGLGPPILLL